MKNLENFAIKLNIYGIKLIMLIICLLLNAGLNVEEVGQAAPDEQGGDDEEKTTEHSGDRGEQPCRKGDSLEKSAEYRDPGVDRDHRAEEE